MRKSKGEKSPSFVVVVLACLEFSMKLLRTGVYGDEQRRVSFQQTQNLSLSTLVAASSRSALLELGESNDIEGLRR
ncbi:hypothetical protein V6N11_012508 [Hibiscus sabdariffa]|uniref:Uncharacterized protein n=2 Tax=Hibiscus sabdariffa TaxID=183260 RepID=A0ABR2QBF6_9ROSI